MKILFVSSAGGHFSELLKITETMQHPNSVIITERKGAINPSVDYYIPYSNRTNKFIYLFAFMRNLLLATIHLAKERPDIIISTGAHTAFFYFIIGKLLFKTTNIYIESYAKVDSVSLTYKLSKKYLDEVIVQHEEMLEHIPEANYYGGVY